MGFKTSLYAVGPGVPRLDLVAHAEGGPEAAAEAAQRWYPGVVAESLGTADLFEGGYPGEAQLYVATFGPTTVFGGGPVLGEHRDRLSAAAAQAGLMSWELNIHSVVDLCQFEVHDETGRIVRALDVYSDKDPATVATDAVGEPLPFEVHYWAGEHDELDDYPHLFHPLELGEAAMAWMFGSSGEGAPDDAVQREIGELLDPFDVPMHGFRVGTGEARRKGLFRRRG
ncbi:DUF6928 family protein [Pedococcus bigeumensis]|uniref:Uncharacterized protein n=1 Tax=Pedococcus bigeumensis TaxID=433644 RepID=A0A502CYF3_9MICO|nr:hypothetical protein [Pedococcus bigeumensis]TPG17189.1 hypothetical protein EAH86_10530 [Pedococcus bigeumensis]